MLNVVVQGVSALSWINWNSRHSDLDSASGIKEFVVFVSSTRKCSFLLVSSSSVFATFPQQIDFSSTNNHKSYVIQIIKAVVENKLPPKCNRFFLGSRPPFRLSATGGGRRPTFDSNFLTLLGMTTG